MDTSSFDPTSPSMIIFGIMGGVLLVIICCCMGSNLTFRESYNCPPSISEKTRGNVNNIQKILFPEKLKLNVQKLLDLFPVIGICVVGVSFIVMLICSVLLVMFPESPSDLVSAMTISALLFLVLFFAGLIVYGRLSTFSKIVQILLKIYWIGTFTTASAVMGFCLISQLLSQLFLVIGV